MKKILSTSAVIVAGSLLLAGCATPLPTGAFYTDTKTGVYESSPAGTKTGKACNTSILGLVATGDASIDAAKKAGGITRVTSVNYEVNNVLGFYGQYCTVVKGN